MAIILSQQTLVTKRGAHSVVATLVKLTGTSANSITLPNMSATSNAVVQLRRPGDSAATVSQSNTNTVNVTGSDGQEVLLVSSHFDPVVTGPIPGTAF